MSKPLLPEPHSIALCLQHGSESQGQAKNRHFIGTTDDFSTLNLESYIAAEIGSELGVLGEMLCDFRKMTSLVPWRHNEDGTLTPSECP